MKASWLMFKDRLHFPPPPFCNASPPTGCKEEFSPACWWESVMLTYSNTCRSGCVIFIRLFMFFCQRMCVYVWYSSTSLHTLWLNRVCEAFEAWLVNIDTGVRVLFQGAVACWNWKKERKTIPPCVGEPTAFTGSHRFNSTCFVFSEHVGWQIMWKAVTKWFENWSQTPKWA